LFFENIYVWQAREKHAFCACGAEEKLHFARAARTIREPEQ
jgi:hypothetical protein